VGHPVSEPYKSMHSWDRDYSPERLQPLQAGEGV
jgi:hypothetical protein